MSGKSFLAAGLTCLVLGCSTVPKIPIDKFYKMIDVDESTIEIDTQKNGHSDVVSDYRVVSRAIVNNETEMIDLLDYQNSNIEKKFIIPDFSNTPKISPDEICLIQVDSEVHFGISTKKDGNIDMVLDFNAKIGADGIYLDLMGYKTRYKGGYQLHPNPKYHSDIQIEAKLI
jgi:hypothetical protein